MPTDRTILHCDLNGFFASVEMLAHPELSGKPVAVGGDPKKRKGVILAKNEEAKKYGVSTGEAIWQAKRKCPNLTILPTHHELYEEYSRKVNEIYSRFTSRVEPFGIDESWLDVSASSNLFGDGKAIADKLRETVKKELGLTISVGVSFNKVFAKLGSDYKKPDATTVFDRDAVETIIYKLPVKDLLYVGKNTAEKLRRLGIKTIGDLANTNELFISRLLGKHGLEIRAFARGEDTSPVAYYGDEDDVKSVGNSITFKRDLVCENDFRIGYQQVAEKVSKRMKAENLKAYGISIVIKGSDFSVITRQTTISVPTNSYRELVKIAMQLTRNHWSFETPVRMLGISCSKLCDKNSTYQQADLFAEQKNDADNKAEDVMFKIKEKFGNTSISFGNMLDSDL